MTDRETRSFTKPQFTEMLAREYDRGVITGIDGTLNILRTAAAELMSPDNTKIRTCILDLCNIIEQDLRNPLHATQNATPNPASSPHRFDHDDLRKIVPPEIPS